VQGNELKRQQAEDAAAKEGLQDAKGRAASAKRTRKDLEEEVKQLTIGMQDATASCQVCVCAWLRDWMRCGCL